MVEIQERIWRAALPSPEAGLEGGDHPPVRPHVGPAPGSHGRADQIFRFCDMQGQAYCQGRNISEELASQITWEAIS